MPQKKPAADKVTESINLRVTPGEMHLIAARAAADKRSVAQTCRVLVLQALGQSPDSTPQPHSTSVARR